MSAVARRVLGPEAAERLRPLNRLRWIEKTRQARAYGAPWSKTPLSIARYVLWDPEVGDHSYDLANREEFAAGVAAAFDSSLGVVLGLFDEAESDPWLSTDLEDVLRRRPGMPSKPGFGPRLGWYAAVRLRRPGLVVETGVKHGFGALLLLAALRRNAAEGFDGHLISIDESTAAGSLVPAAFRDCWTLVHGRTPDGLAPALGGREVEMLIHDTPPIAEVEEAEYRLALAHRGDRLALINGTNGLLTPVLGHLAIELGRPMHVIDEQADHPIYPGDAVCVVVDDR